MTFRDSIHKCWKSIHTIMATKSLNIYGTSALTGHERTIGKYGTSGKGEGLG